MMRAAALAVALAVAGCVGAPAVEDLMLAGDPGAPPQSRHYEGVGAEELARAVVAALQDLGFHLKASEPQLGLIVATRGYRKTAGEIASELGTDFLQILKNAFTLQWHRQPDPERIVGPAAFNAAVSITPAASGTTVRLSLHRFVSKPTGEAVVVWAEALPGPEPHQRFFGLVAAALKR